MLSSTLIKLVCISLTVFEISAAFNEGSASSDSRSQDRLIVEELKDEPKTSENEIQPNEDTQAEPQRHHKHKHHHHGRHMAPPPHPGHEFITNIMPMINSMINRVHTKTGKLYATGDQKIEKESKARAYIVSKFHTRVSETLLGNRKNVTQVYTKNMDQQGETDAVVDFNSDLEVTDTKIVHGRRFEEEKPAEQKNNQEEMSQAETQRYGKPLRRFRREAEQQGANSPLKSAFEKIVSSVKEAANTLANEWNKAAAGVKQKIEEHKKKMAEKQKQGQGGQTDTEAPSTSPPE